MVTRKKAYIRPEVTRRGDVEDITQGFGELGSGDLWAKATKHDGCYLNNSRLCTYS